MNNYCLKGKSAIVTGARRGIGKAIAVAFAAVGADVAACDIVMEDGLLHNTRDELEKLGSKAIALTADISRRGDVESMVRKTLEIYGKSMCW